ncbi:uncharacterized protein TRIADDRAFT_27568 [Trichoplax adhaerens]|uniref:Pyrroline-5-carboxylate reductase n=1 Tax=Trichoplax adhaerens TaxID=10228 RepID=B3S202_TRIAD|nr:hypothetical protein TRIADDRAFT_27568 [Trichoplax adhaerens]EDV23280.1 hypothetical protein TRIADDRAFT_27568 [Trichoplax adhaerens]|eukprot:XP_002114190.1 hypothetical protein TRIADDRAFT_27568 [Trichoplax adhaerens]
MTIGFIGAGKMAQALASGFIASRVASVDKLFASAPSMESLQGIKEKINNINVTTDNKDIVRKNDVIIVAVKPNILSQVLKEIAPVIRSENLIISVAAGIRIPAIEDPLPNGTRVVRVMPNTPCLVGAGASAYSLGTYAQSRDAETVNKLMSAVGLCEKVPESLIDAVVGVSGSGPAYMFVAIEALADGGVKAGLPRHLALKLAAQTLLGAGKMVMEIGAHPAELKDEVCSPGGTTIAAVHTLEKNGFRGALIDAVLESCNRSRELGN